MADTLGTHNPLRYRGYVYDAETGLYYLQSRYYDPGMGRFINGDGFTSTGQGLLSNNMFAYCYNDPVNNLDQNGYGPFGYLTLRDYYTIHKMVQFDCVIRCGYDMEVSVKNAAGKGGRLDLYDIRNNTYYEVKSKGASRSPNTPLQMKRYDSSTIVADRYKEYNISQPPLRGTQSITGSIPYGLYDVKYELSAPGLIVYDPQINWNRTAAYISVAGLITLGVVTSGQSLPATIPVMSELIPGLVS